MSTPKILVNRKDDGIAEFIFTHKEKTITGSGFWDDATPWGEGTYKASPWLFSGTSQSFRIGTEATPNPIPGRTKITFHTGTDTGNSEGCLVDPGITFISDVYDYLRAQELAPTLTELYSNRHKKGIDFTTDFPFVEVERNNYSREYAPIDVEFRGNFEYDVQLNIRDGKTEFIEGDEILLDIELSGNGASNGISKDLWFHLDFEGSGDLNKDLQTNGFSAAPPESTNIIKDDGQWVKLASGQDKVTVTLNSLFDDQKEDVEDFSVTIDDYAIKRVSSAPFPVGGTKFYQSEGKFPINGSNDNVSFTLKDQEEIFDQLTESGNQGNFTFSAPVAPNQIIKGQFTSFSIPDRMIVKDGNNTLLDTGKVSVTNDPISFTIPQDSKGSVSITVEAPLGGTAWNFSLSSDGFANQNLEEVQVISPFSTLALAATLATTPAVANSSEWVVNTYTQSFLTEGKVNDTAQGIGFSVSNDVGISHDRAVGWRVKPIGNNPISANDFEGNELPSGLLGMVAGEAISDQIYFEYFDTSQIPDDLPQDILDAIVENGEYWGLKQDGINESEETWTIELYDAVTGEVIPASFNGQSTFSVRDSFNFIEPENGTNKGELFNGSNQPDIINGSGGNDTINGNGGNDILSGENGADIINGSGGNDTIIGGFGNDTINGGDGVDIVRIARPEEKISLTRQPDGSYILNDLSAVPLGTDVLLNIEKVELSDTTIDLLPPKSSKNEILGTDASETLIGTADDDAIEGLGGEDTIYGNEGDDLVNGGDGNDTIWGWTGNDELNGQDGDDFIGGDTGDDTITGGSGDDTLFGWEGNDSINGLHDNDLMNGEAGNDTLEGWTGNDTIFGDEGDDSILAGSGEDSVIGGNGADYISGYNDNDTLSGNDGADTIHGGDGDDLITGGLGQDVIRGDAGADIFDYNALTESTDAGFDRIKGFEVGIDKIDVSDIGVFFGLDTDGGQTENGEFRLTHSVASDRTYIRSDQFDFEIALEGGNFTGTLTDGDFIY